MLRNLLIRQAKSALRAVMQHPAGRKLMRLAHEEREIHLAAQAVNRLKPVLASRLGMAVRNGPFAGMVYPTMEAAGSALIPKIVGCYEEEIQEAVEQLCQRRPDLIIDIGAAEGYYAVGLARRVPDATIIAFDGDPAAQHLLHAMASANGVQDRITVRSWCGVDDLRALTLGPGTAVISDCEGAEYQLINPVTVPALAQCDILLEVHRNQNLDTWAHWQRVLSPTHELEAIHVRGREGADYPDLNWLDPDDRHWVVFERSRGSIAGWLLATPKRRPQARSEGQA